MEEKIKYLQEWLDLSVSGKFEEAKELYYQKLFPVVLEKFKNAYSEILSEEDTLISILGFSPEPIILTAVAMKPLRHVCITNDKTDDSKTYFDQFLQHDYSIIRLEDIDFKTIYRTLKEQLVISNSSRIVVDITGGKKSMVAAAAIFGKDYGCKIVYVDFAEYIKELRKPMPGSEMLNVVYDPKTDQPEVRIN